MLIDLVPDFFTVIQSVDPVAAYQRYFETYRQIVEPYWKNYVVDPDSPHFAEIVRTAMDADRHDLRTLLDHVDVATLVRETAARCAALLEMDSDADTVIMVGVGAANAGELVADGRGMAFVCLEHFTGVANPGSHGLGLDPELIPLWLAHELAHVVRYTSPTSRSRMRGLVAEAGGNYSYWDTGHQAPLREHLVNEGLAVETARAVSPGHADWEYFGYHRRQYSRIRELEPVIVRYVAPQLDTAGLGLRLRYLSGGTSENARRLDRIVIPERAGYYLGSRMVRSAIVEHGFPWAIRASAEELRSSGNIRAETA